MTSMKKNVLAATAILLGYVALYLLARLLYTEPGNYTLHQWLWGGWQQLDYLFGWMLDWFWKIAAISVISAVTGRYRFGAWLWFGCTAGLLLGEPLGETSTYLHYGWWIWVTFMLISLVAGILTERVFKKHGTCRHKSFLVLVTAAVIAYGWVILDTLMIVRSY